jgi:uncharacterized protein YqeY
VLSAIQAREATENRDLIVSEIISIIKKEVKMFEESADIFADKNPLESKTYAIKAQICADLLPDQIDDSQYDLIVSKAIAKTGASSIRDMGDVVKNIKESYPDVLDMRVVSGIVKENLGKFA